MIRTMVLGLIGALMFCGTSNADFLFDNFSSLANDGGPTVDLGNGVFVDVSTDMVGGDSSFSSVGNRYSLIVAGSDIGSPASFSVAYTWGGVNFQDLAGVGPDYILDNIPTHFTSANWSASYDVGDGNTGYTPGTEISLFNRTQLTLTIGYVGGANPQVSFGEYGGAVPVSLVAVPEPTSLLMFGSIVALGFTRRRRR